MKTLKLTMSHKWYDMIASGEKTVEYREVKLHWIKMLTLFPISKEPKMACVKFNKIYAFIPNSPEYPEWFFVDFKKYDAVQFFRGAYLSEKLPNMTFELKDIQIDYGREEWGATKNEKYFCLILGAKL